MKKPLCIAFAFIFGVGLCMGAFSLSALAAVNPDYQVPVASSAPSYDDMFTGYNDGTSDCRFWVNSTRLVSSGDVVCCAYPGYLLFLSTVKPSGYWLYYDYGPGHSSGNVNTYNTISVNGVSYYIKQWTVSPAYTVLCESYSDYDSALAACIAALTYSPPPDPVPSPPSSFSIVVPPGYAIVIDSSSGFQAQFDAFMPSKNVLEVFYSEFGSRWWPYSPVQYSLRSTSFNLAVGSSLPLSGSSFVPWSRVATDVFGQTKQAHWTTAVFSSHFLLYNPYLYLYSPPLGGQQEDFNNTPVTILITDISPGWSYTLYELSDSVSMGVSSSTLSSTVTKILDMDPDYYGGFVDSSGNPVSPKNGGALSTDNAQEVTLNQIVADLDNFFRGTWDHVRYLINVLSDFPAFVVQLYSWLPGDFRAVLFSAFSLAMVFGVLKVML